MLQVLDTAYVQVLNGFGLFCLQNRSRANIWSSSGDPVRAANDLIALQMTKACADVGLSHQPRRGRDIANRDTGE